MSRRQGLEVLTHIGDFVADYLQHKGVAEQAAAEAGAKCAGEVADQFGGQIFYLPRNVANRTAETHAQIVAAFTGHNHVELSAQFRLSVQTIYKILKADRMVRGLGAT